MRRGNGFLIQPCMLSIFTASAKVDISYGNMMCDPSILHPSSLLHAHMDATGKTTGSLIPHSQDTSSSCHVERNILRYQNHGRHAYQ